MPVEVVCVIKVLPIIGSILEQNSFCNLIGLGQINALRYPEQREHVVLNSKFLNEFQATLPRKIISGNVIFACIDTCEDTADVASRDLLVK